jgi:hypothetical protein
MRGGESGPTAATDGRTANYLDEIARRLGVPVDGCMLAVAWMGPGDLHPLITGEDVAAYAAARLVTASPSETGPLITLLNAAQADRETVREAIHLLMAVERCDLDRALLAWSVVLLEKLLSELPEDPVAQLTALSSFWAVLRYPPFSPHVVQGRDDAMAPEDYYAATHAAEVLRRHVTWVEDAKHRLRASWAGHPVSDPTIE